MDEKRLVDGTTALAEKQPRVIKIEPAEQTQNVRLRVAAYTRVSSDSEDQLNSFAAQNRYYTELISGKAEWRMVDIYADGGITGTSVAKRDDFQRMMADCRRGLIDQILVKSISRFARNTKDCLQNIRELKELGVNVRFEREGIDTVNVSSELITAIYAAFAQKESESISGNRQWGYQRSMEQGTFNTYYAPVGFTLIDGNLQINQAEAPTIQRIFTEYLSGNNSREIAAALNKDNSPTLDEAPLQQAILAALNTAMADKNSLIRQITDAMETEIIPFPGGTMSLGDIERRLRELEQQFQTLLDKATDDPAAYGGQFKEILDEQTFLKEKRSGILADNNEQAKANQRIQDAAQTLENTSPHITEWDESALRQLVETVKVLSKDEIAITLKGGIEICQKIMY